HADALPGAEEVSAGGYDDQALSELGRRQAETLAERLRPATLGAVYSSPIGRAQQTAAYVAAPHGLDGRGAPGLREGELGPIGQQTAGPLTPEELSALLRARLREIAIIAVTTGRWSSIPGSEPSAALRSRLVAALDHITTSHPSQRVAVVSHAGAINAYLAAVLGLEQDYFFPTANTSISVVRINGRRRMLFSLNDIGHLLAANLFTP